MSSYFNKEALESYVNTTIQQLDDFIQQPELISRLVKHPNFHKFVIGSIISGGSIYGIYKVSLIFFKKLQIYKKYSEKLSTNKKNLEKEFKLTEVDKKKKKKINVDGVFLERLMNILKIAIPGVYTKEFEYFIILTVLLFSRTILTVQIAEILGTNAQFLVGRKYTDLLIGVAKFQFLSFNKIDSLL
jgi:hypothetical protein